MPDDYLSFLDQRAVQRRLQAKFAQPRLLLLHTIAFVGVATVLWVAISPWLRWIPQYDLVGQPALLLFAWSIVLAAHALVHYRRSSAVAEKRERAVEDQMRHLIEKTPDQVDDTGLFAMHQNLGGALERQGWLSQGLTVFALVNLASWFGAALNLGTNWGYFLTLPTAIVLVAGVYGFRAWQYSRRTGHDSWLNRLPLRHIVVYAVGITLLAIFGMARMINPWDVDTLRSWWTILLVLHILWEVVLAPVSHRFAAAKPGVGALVKRKPAERLVLADDGEIVPATEIDVEQRHANAR